MTGSKKVLKIAIGVVLAVILIYSFIPGNSLPYEEHGSTTPGNHP